MAEIIPGTSTDVPPTDDVTVIPNPPASAGAGEASAPNETKLDVLLGVHLSLTLRFGQRILPLREILDLNAGAIIELDREVEEPADLLLGDKVIARGQVVIVDGNYGLRITEVLDAQGNQDHINSAAAPAS